MRIAPGIAALLLGLSTATAGRGDLLVIGGTRHVGTFEGFADNTFRFRDANGNLLDPYRTRVRSLDVDAPVAVTLVRKGKQDGQPCELTGYTGGKFNLLEDGQPSVVAAMYVDRVEPRAASRAPDEGPADTVLEVSALMTRGDLTPRQALSLRRYVAARKVFDDYVADSTAMVRQMDHETGKRRDQLLGILRQRKIEEQTHKRALEQAQATLLADIPPPWGSPESAGTEASRSPAQPGLPDLDEGQVLLLDVSALRRLPDLTSDQVRALDRYEAAVDVYQAGLADPDSPRDKNARRVAQAQAVLLQAFPGMKLITE